MSSRVRILLLDDSPAERELAREALDEYGGGCDLLAVATPDEAELAITTFAPHVVLIDLHLGRWNGRDVIPRLPADLPSVVLSTTNDPQEAARCRAAGAAEFWV